MKGGVGGWVAGSAAACLHGWSLAPASAPQAQSCARRPGCTCPAGAAASNTAAAALKSSTPRAHLHQRGALALLCQVSHQLGGLASIQPQLRGQRAQHALAVKVARAVGQAVNHLRGRKQRRKGGSRVARSGRGACGEPCGVGAYRHATCARHSQCPVGPIPSPAPPCSPPNTQCPPPPSLPPSHPPTHPPLCGTAAGARPPPARRPHPPPPPGSPSPCPGSAAPAP